MASESDWRSYRTAVVDLYPHGCPPLRITPDPSGTTGVWPDWATAPMYIVTAWNPDSVRTSLDVNRARHAGLIAELDTAGLAHIPAVGRDVDSPHAEEGVAVTDMTEPEALDLGRRHGQAAIYLWTPRAWSIVACAGDRRERFGWHGRVNPESSGPVP